VFAFLAGSIKAVLAVISVFVVCIVIHEFGHYIVAKRFGVAVPAFAIGFGPKLVKWVRHGTEYSIRLFPIGGLVQLAGDMPQDALFRIGEEIAFRLDEQGRVVQLGDRDDVPNGQIGVLRNLDLLNRLEMTIETEQDTKTYQLIPHARLMTSARSSIPLVEKHEQVLGKPLFQRAAIILAGPIMNFLLAGVLFTLTFAHQGIPIQSPVIGQVVSGSAASVAGLKAGDTITAVNGVPIQSWRELVTQIQSDRRIPPTALTLSVMRAGEMTKQIIVTPRLTPQNTPLLGVDAAVSHDPSRALPAGFTFVYTGSVDALGMYRQVFVHHQFQNLSGPVGIADVIGQQAQSGIWQVIWIAGLLSLNLGLFNLLPIPALDGGRLLFMFVELLRGKTADPRKEGYVHLVGFALLMLFAVIITYRDVTRLF